MLNSTLESTSTHKLSTRAMRGPLRSFHRTFAQFHPYLAFCICILGIIANSCLLGVLSRPRMRSTVNRLLMAIAAIDTALMVSYSIYLAHFQIGDRHKCPIHLFTYEWIVFQLVHADISVYARACTLWLSATVAGYSKHVTASATQVQYENPRLATRLTCGVALAVLAASAPVFLQNSAIREGPRAPENDTTCPANHSPYYVIEAPEFAASSPGAGAVLSKITFMFNGIILKFLPCLLLAYFLAFLLHALYAHKKWRADKFTSNGAGQQRNSILSNHSSAPTVLILTTVLCTTLICELPNAVLSLICSLSSAQFIKEVYVNLGDMLDLLSLLSCTTTSILYCVMSHLFRETFLDLFFRRRVSYGSTDTQERQGDHSGYTAGTRSRRPSPASPSPYQTFRGSHGDKIVHLDTLQPLLGSNV